MQTSLSQKIIDYIQARYAAFYLKTAETERANRLIEQVANQLNLTVMEYNLAYGKVDFQYKAIQKDYAGKIEESFKDLLDEDLENSLIFIRNAKMALEHNPLAISRLQHLIEKIERHNQLSPNEPCAVILQSAETFIPADIEPYITLFELAPPNENKIKEIINTFNDLINIFKTKELYKYKKHKEIEHKPQKYNRRRKRTISIDDSYLLVRQLYGLNEIEIKKLLTLITNKFYKNKITREEIIIEIQNQKEQIIAKSGVLEMVKVTNKIDDIGGLENLKKWLKEQSEILNNLDEALQFGVKAPKGTLIVGMPGCGKSLTAKAAATLFQQPLLRLDIGSLLGKYVGESESNMRKALKIAESISPCVLWVDELEKAFVGMMGNNASEVSSRLLGYFLTWMQEKTNPVFIIATANDITALPPELLRKGRFDEIFFVGFPNDEERKHILKIHLNKANQNSSEFNIDDLSTICKGYSGADIENSVYDAIKNAFLSSEKQLTQELLKKSLEQTIPLSKTLKDKVNEYEKKFEILHLTPASTYEGLSLQDMIKMANNPNYLERIKVAEHNDVTEDILELLINDEKLEVRKAAFRNKNCPTKLLDKQIQLTTKDHLFSHELVEIVANHKNTSDSLVVSIFNTNSERDILIREQIARRKNLSQQAQSILAKDKENRVITALANNLSISEETIRVLRKAYVSHKNLTSDAVFNIFHRKI